MKRRAVMAAGGVALGAGVGWQIWRQHDANPGIDAIWSLRLERPGGGELVFADLRGAPLLLNFWATWCPPCVREMPELDRFQRAHAAGGWRVVGLAVDREEPVVDYLKRVPISFAVALAGADGMQWSRRLGNSAGALPFSAVFDKSGRVLARRLGATDADELDRWARLA